jgi:hypothetical protein
LSPLETGNLPRVPNLTRQGIQATGFTLEKFEDFEGVFPNNWAMPGSNRIWTDVPCLALSGFWSAWPTGTDGVGGVNPCSGNNYLPNADAWLVYGPFSLANADFAFFDFYSRLQIENCNPITACDYLFRGASIDGINFYGHVFAGDQTNGPYLNGYSAFLFDLDSVPTLGNLMGQPQVWVGFYFHSDFIFEFSGPFIDNVTVGILTPDISSTYLPIIVNTPTQKTSLSVWNNTTNVLQSYVVKNVTLNNTPIGNISCPANIPAGQTRFCGTFDANIYQVTLLANQCPNFSGGTRPFNPGPVTAEVRCPSK